MDSSVSRPRSEDPATAASGSPGRRNVRRRGAAAAGPGPAPTELQEVGLHVERRFTREGVHPFDEVTWEQRTAAIANEKGEIVFEQTDCEVPTFWSQEME